MRLFDPATPPCDAIGYGLVSRIASLQHGPRVHRVRWRWMLDWWDRRRSTKRRGTRVA